MIDEQSIVSPTTVPDTEDEQEPVCTDDRGRSRERGRSHDPEQVCKKRRPKSVVVVPTNSSVYRTRIDDDKYSSSRLYTDSDAETTNDRKVPMQKRVGTRRKTIRGSHYDEPSSPESSDSPNDKDKHSHKKRCKSLPNKNDERQSKIQSSNNERGRRDNREDNPQNSHDDDSSNGLDTSRYEGQGHSNRCNRKQRPSSRDDSTSTDTESPRKHSTLNKHDKLRSQTRKKKHKRRYSSSRSKSNRSRHNLIKPDKYDGTTCVETFLVKFRSCCEYNGWRSKDKAAHLKASLTGGAGLLLWESEDATYEQMVEKLRRRYGSRDQQERFRVELKNKKRQQNQSLQELAQEVEKLVMLAYPEAGLSTRNILGRDAFVDSLNNPGFEYKIKEKEPDSLDGALRLAMKLEVLYKSRDVQREPMKPRLIRGVQPNDGRTDNQNRQTVLSNPVMTKTNGDFKKVMNNGAGVAQQTKPNGQNNEYEELKREIQRLTEELAESKKATQEFQQLMQRNFAQPQDYNYQYQQQPYYYYPQEVTQQQTPNETPVYPNNNRPHQGRIYACYNCAEIGHLKRNCPHPQRQQRTSNEQTPTPKARGSKCKPNDGGKVYLNVKINKQSHQCLLDSGCAVTLIPADMVERRKIRYAYQSVLAANGTEIPILGWATVKAKIGKKHITIEGLVSEHVSELMLGEDWLTANRVIWNFAEGVVSLHGNVYQLTARKGRNNWCRRVVLAEDTVIPPRSQVDLNTKTVYRHLNSHTDTGPATWSTEPRILKDKLLVARSMLPDRLENVPVRVLNTTKTPVILEKGTSISNLQPVSPLTSEQPHADSALQNDEVIDDMLSRVDDSVPEEVRLGLREVLNKYSTVFSRNEWDLGWTDIVTVLIQVIVSLYGNRLGATLFLTYEQLTSILMIC